MTPQFKGSYGPVPSVHLGTVTDATSPDVAPILSYGMEYDTMIPNEEKKRIKTMKDNNAEKNKKIGKNTNGKKNK